MKILVVCQYYYPENFTVTPICESLAARGHDVLVVTGKPNYGYGRILEGYEKIREETLNGVRVRRVNLYPRKKSRISIIRNYLSFWRNSKRYVARLKEEFDVVYSMSLSPIISVSAANKYAKKHSIPHVLHCLDLWPESVLITHALRKNSLSYALLYRWSESIYSKASKILLSSPSFADYFRDVLNIDNVPLVYTPQPPLLAKKEGEAEFSAPYNLVYAGNIGTLQLVENLVKAMPKAREKVDVHLHLIGMGARTEAVKRLIEELHLEESVFFYGTKPRGVTAGFYEQSTGIVISLVNEGAVGKTIPNKLVSAFVHGKPFLACIGGDGRKELEAAGGSIFAENETPEAFAEAIVRLCSLSEEERKTLGENNARYFEAVYSFDKVIDRLESELKI